MLAESGNMLLSEAVELIAKSIVASEKTANGKSKKLKSVKERLSAALRRVRSQQQQSGNYDPFFPLHNLHKGEPT